jgi:hypothetical protein
MKEQMSMEKRLSRPAARRLGDWTAVVAGLALAAAAARADQVVMKNGDRYTGSVLSLDAESVVVQSELLGKVTLPRGKTVLITIGSNAPAPVARPVAPAKTPPPAAPVASTNTTSAGAAVLRSLMANTNLVQEVRDQYLGAAGAEANRKFDELLNGLMSGKVTLEDLRTQARSAMDQLRAFKKEFGDDASELDDYLNILEKFLKESGPAQSSGPAPAAGARGSRLPNDSETP